jgi:hypothetical protein
MSRRSIKRRSLWGLMAGLALSAVSTALAGGFSIVVEPPGADRSAGLKDAYLIVSAVGCHGPGATVHGTAEGLVEGRRQSVPLKLTNVGSDRFAVQRAWPATGVWVLAFTAVAPPFRAPDGKTHRFTADVLVELGPKGEVRTVASPGAGDAKRVSVRYLGGQPKAKAIAESLRALAMKSGGKAQSAVPQSQN